MEKINLKNGIRVLFTPNETSVAFAMSVFVYVGARYDPKGKEGLSHFVEHMALKRTDKFSKNRELSKAIDSIGAFSESYTSKEQTCYNIWNGILHAERCIEIMSEIVMHPILSPEDVENEKSVIFAEILMEHDDAGGRLIDSFDDFYYKNSAIGRRTLGTKDSVQSITPEDIIYWYTKFYRPENILISVTAHDDQKQKILEWIEQYFSSSNIIPLAVRRYGSELEYTPFSYINRRDNILVIRHSDEQGQLMMASQGLPFKHKDGLVMWVLANVFGGSQSSLLVNRLQDELGLNYELLCYSYSFSDCGNLNIITQCDNNKIFQVFEEILLMIRDFEKNITDNDVEIAKQVTISRIFLMMDDDSLKTAYFTGILFMYGIESSFEELIAGINAVTKEQIITLAKDIFSKQIPIVVMGKYKELEARKKLKAIQKKILGHKNNQP